MDKINRWTEEEERKLQLKLLVPCYLWSAPIICLQTIYLCRSIDEDDVHDEGTTEHSHSLTLDEEQGNQSKAQPMMT